MMSGCGWSDVCWCQAFQEEWNEPKTTSHDVVDCKHLGPCATKEPATASAHTVSAAFFLNVLSYILTIHAFLANIIIN
jgi:hypothetical protein